MYNFRERYQMLKIQPIYDPLKLFFDPQSKSKKGFGSYETK